MSICLDVLVLNASSEGNQQAHSLPPWILILGARTISFSTVGLHINLRNLHLSVR